jgi:hypothetical protein
VTLEKTALIFKTMPEIEFGLPIDYEGLRVELPPEVTLRQRVQKYFEFDTTGTSLNLFLLTWAASIPASVIGCAIWDAVKKRSAKEPPKRILIDETHIEFDQGRITRFIQKRIELQEGTSNND